MHFNLEIISILLFCCFVNLSLADAESTNEISLDTESFPVTEAKSDMGLNHQLKKREVSQVILKIRNFLTICRNIIIQIEKRLPRQTEQNEIDFDPIIMKYVAKIRSYLFKIRLVFRFAESLITTRYLQDESPMDARFFGSTIGPLGGLIARTLSAYNSFVPEVQLLRCVGNIFERSLAPVQSAATAIPAGVGRQAGGAPAAGGNERPETYTRCISFYMMEFVMRMMSILV